MKRRQLLDMLVFVGYSLAPFAAVWKVSIWYAVVASSILSLVTVHSTTPALLYGNEFD